MKNKYIQWTLIFVVGLGAGWLFFAKSSGSKTAQSIEKQAKTTVWTCSMHPQIRQDHPGKCPLCGMDLIPLQQTNDTQSTTAIELSPDAMQLANVQTSVIKRTTPVKEIRLFGRVETDERSVTVLPAHLPGRVDRLLVNFTGDVVTQGQTIAVIYSPQLVQAQQELIEAKKLNNAVPGVLEAAREKLRQWKLTPKQIASVENSERPITEFDVKSTLAGVITKKLVNQGDYVSQGAALYEVTDLSRLWVLFDVYESDLAWIKQGDKVDFTMQSLPGKEFSGRVSFIAPTVDNKSRAVKVRVELNNSGREFKPGMFATGMLKAPLGSTKESLVIPRSALLWTGKRSVVYVKLPNTATPSFEMREIVTGADLGESIVVSSGLKEGEEIVTNGVFSVDAAAQLAGKNSMMNRTETAPVDTKSTSVKVATHHKVVYVCPMKEDSEIIQDHPGKCTKCGMDLVKKEI